MHIKANIATFLAVSLLMPGFAAGPALGQAQAPTETKGLSAAPLWR